MIPCFGTFTPRNILHFIFYDKNVLCLFRQPKNINDTYVRPDPVLDLLDQEIFLQRTQKMTSQFRIPFKKINKSNKKINV